MCPCAVEVPASPKQCWVWSWPASLAILALLRIALTVSWNWTSPFLAIRWQIVWDTIVAVTLKVGGSLPMAQKLVSPVLAEEFWTVGRLGEVGGTCMWPLGCMQKPLPGCVSPIHAVRSAQACARYTQMFMLLLFSR